MAHETPLKCDSTIYYHRLCRPGAAHKVHVHDSTEFEDAFKCENRAVSDSVRHTMAATIPSILCECPSGIIVNSIEPIHDKTESVSSSRLPSRSAFHIIHTFEVHRCSCHRFSIHFERLLLRIDDLLIGKKSMNSIRNVYCCSIVCTFLFLRRVRVCVRTRVENSIGRQAKEFQFISISSQSFSFSSNDIHNSLDSSSFLFLCDNEVE